MIDSVVEDLGMYYPELYPGSDEKMVILKREIAYFMTLSDKEKAEVRVVQRFD